MRVFQLLPRGLAVSVVAALLAVIALAQTAHAQSAEAPSRTRVEQDDQQRADRIEPELRNLKRWNEGLKAERPQEEQRRVAAWQTQMRQIPPPEEGNCFEASYPELAWKRVECVRPPEQPMAPHEGPRPFTIGDGNNVSAEVPTAPALISRAIGSFDSVSGVTSVSSDYPDGTSVAGRYSLQLNTDFFSTTACAPSPNPGCRGWQQFVFSNDGSNGYVFMQYWLIRYNTACPSGWNTFSFSGSSDIYCWKNSAGAPATPNQPISNLSNLTVTGTVNTGSDSVMLTFGTDLRLATDFNPINTHAGWTMAEFGIFGDCCLGEATLNVGSTIVPRTRIIYGGITAPNCVATGFTGETNNLSFGPAPPAATAPGPAVIVTESSAGGAVANCAAATSVGDTHLTTFGGLLYDFQSAGDFVLAEIESDFAVQARQVSGAPRWPNASVNTAVAMQLGKTRVAICMEPEPRVLADGIPLRLEDGKPRELSEGVDILKIANAYYARDPVGNSVRAVLNDGWINVTVGLGRWPVKVRGLLFNTDEFGLEASDGEVLVSPISFETLYRKYGESWRVTPKASLLADCGANEVEEGIPSAPFYAGDLEDDVLKRSMALCAEFGVTDETLLEACALDVAVIGNVDAARVFAGTAPPVAVIRPTP